jgi:hypothetical protein
MTLLIEARGRRRTVARAARESRGALVVVIVLAAFPLVDGGDAQGLGPLG